MEDDLNDNAFTVKNISLDNGPSNLDMDKLNSISNSINNKPKVVSPIEFMTTSETKIFLEKLTITRLAWFSFCIKGVLILITGGIL